MMRVEITTGNEKSSVVATRVVDAESYRERKEPIDEECTVSKCAWATAYPRLMCVGCVDVLSSLCCGR